MKPPASAPTGSAASGKLRWRRRPNSRGVSPGRRLAPAISDIVIIRFQTPITVRGLKYLATPAATRSIRASSTPRIVVSVPASGVRKIKLAGPEPELLGSRNPGGSPLGVGTPPPVVVVTPGSQFSSRRHSACPWEPRVIGS